MYSHQNDYRAPDPRAFALALNRAAMAHAEASGAIHQARVQVGRIGAERPTYLQQAQQWLAYTRQTIFDVANAPPAYFRYQINESLRTVGQLVQDAMNEGNKAVAESLQRTANALAESMRQLGTGAGDAFEGFWGIPPWALLGGGMLFVGAMATGGSLLFLSPAGQAVGLSAAQGLATAGVGVGKALLFKGVL